VISLHRINEKEIMVNSELIEFVEELPNTMICMSSGKKVVVRESADEVRDKVIEYKHKIMSGDIVRIRTDE